MIIRWLFNDYLMIIWYYCVYLSYLINIWKNMQSEWLTQFCICQAILLLNSCGQACLSSEGNLWFAWFITAKHPLRILMLAVRIKRTRGWKLAIVSMKWYLRSLDFNGLKWLWVEVPASFWNHCQCQWICILNLLFAKMGRKVWSSCSSSCCRSRNNKEEQACCL